MEMSITVIAVVIGAFIVLKFMRKFTSKIIGVIGIVGLVLGFMYYKGMGPFTKNVADVAHLTEKYCEPEGGDADICDCILSYAKEDMNTRFSAVEIEALSEQKIRAAYVLKKSLVASKEKALMCLAARGATDKYKVFLQDFVPIENKYLDLAGQKAKELGAKLKDEVKTFQDNKKGIDSKY